MGFDGYGILVLLGVMVLFGLVYFDDNGDGHA